MNENTNTERLSAEALAEIELSLDSIWLIPRTQRTISANAKIFGHAFALLASHRALEAELAQARAADAGDRGATIPPTFLDPAKQYEYFERVTMSHARDLTELYERLAAVEQRVAKLEGRGNDLDTWEWMAGNSDDSAEFFSERWELVATDANDPWVYIMRRPLDNGGDHE